MLDYIHDSFAQSFMNRHSSCDQLAISSFMLYDNTLDLVSIDIDCSPRFCYTHTSTGTPLCPEAANSYFVHVAWLDLEVHSSSYRKIRAYFPL